MYAVAANLDLSSTGNGLDADGTKLYCTTMAKNVADRAMQVSRRQHKHVQREARRRAAEDIVVCVTLLSFVLYQKGC